MTDNKEIEKKAGTDLAVVDFGDDAGAGLDNITKDERSIPFLMILQSGSKEVKLGSGKEIAGAAASMMINKSTGEIYDGFKVGLEIIPVHRDHNYVEFTVVNAGSGFVTVHADDDPLVLELRAKQGKFGKLWTGSQKNDKGEHMDGTELVETYYLYAMARPWGSDEQFFPVLIPFASTQIKNYTKFINRVTNIKYKDPKTGIFILPPMWAHRWHLKTGLEKKKTFEWYGWNLSLAKKRADGTEAPSIESLVPRKIDGQDNPDYVSAKTFYESIHAGKAKVDYAQTAEATTAGPTDDEVEM